MASTLVGCADTAGESVAGEAGITVGAALAVDVALRPGAPVTGGLPGAVMGRAAVPAAVEGAEGALLMAVS